MQRPSIDGLNTYLISKAVRMAGFKVALSGLGGDSAMVSLRDFGTLRWLPTLRAIDNIPGLPLDMFSRILASRATANSSKVRRLLGRQGLRDGWGFALLLREVLPASLVSNMVGIDRGEIVAASPRRLGAPQAPPVFSPRPISLYIRKACSFPMLMLSRWPHRLSCGYPGLIGLCSGPRRAWLPAISRSRVRCLLRLHSMIIICKDWRVARNYASVFR